MVNDLFCEPESFSSLTNGNNHFILGSIGTGKTIVLKALSLAVRGGHSTSGATFGGIYLPLSPFAHKAFERHYKLTNRHEPFMHYFVLDTIKSAYEQLQVAGVSNTDLLAIDADLRNITGRRDLDSVESRTISSVISELSNRMESILEQLNSYPSTPSLDFSPRRLDLPELLRALEVLRHRIYPSIEGRLALLIDGYDQLGELTKVVNSLIHQEYGQRICVIIACVHFGDFVESDVNGQELVYGRDYDTVVLDEGYHEATETLDQIATGIIIRAWKEFLPAATPDQLSLRSILGPGDQSSLYHGLECFVELSAGNIRWFLLLCRHAFKEVEVEDGLPHVPLASQERAVKSVTHSIYAAEVQSRGRAEAEGILALCDNLGRKLRSIRREGGVETSIRTPIDLPELTDPDDSRCRAAEQILRRALRHRFLITTEPNRVLIERVPGFVPSEARFSGILAPILELPWR